MKRILYVHHGTGLGGAPLSLLYMISGLDKTRFKPIVLFLHDVPVVMQMYKDQGIEVHGPVGVFDVPHTAIWWFRWHHPQYMIRALWGFLKTVFVSAPRWYDALKPDVVHLNTSSLLGWGYVARRRGLPVVWHIREPLAEGYFGIRKRMVTKCVGAYADAIVPLSHHDARPWATLSKTTVIPNAVDAGRFDYRISTGESKVKTPTILYVGGLSHEKGALLILRAFHEVRITMPDARLIIAGPWELKCSSRHEISYYFPLQTFYRQVAQALKLVGDGVEIVGSVTDIPGLMARANVVVFPATKGHFARPIIEAGFMKKPVLASRLSPLDELVVDGKTGLLFDHTDISAWAQGLKKLLEDESLQRKMGLAGYEHCTERFSVPRQVSQITAIYDRFM